jgi:hypothetical protein
MISYTSSPFVHPMCHMSSSGYLKTCCTPPAFCAAEMTSLGTLAHPRFRRNVLHLTRMMRAAMTLQARSEKPRPKSHFCSAKFLPTLYGLWF